MLQRLSPLDVPRRSLFRSLPSLLLVFVTSGCLALGTAQGTESEAGTVQLELVETAPVETTLDQPDLPSTDEVWLEMIRGAERSIELAHFYASNRPGSRLEGVIVALEEAAARGVQVRFLADAGFHETYPDTLDRLGAVEGIELRLYDLRARTGGVLHAKLLLVDGADLFVGSPNFDWRSLEHIQELGLRVRSPEVGRDFSAVFELDWRLAGDAAEVTPLSEEGGPAGAGTSATLRTAAGSQAKVTAAFSPKSLLPRGVAWDLPLLTQWIDEAREEVSIQLLSYRATDRDGYFDTLESALRRAAGRGVRVRLLLADWSKRKGSIEGLQSLQCLPGIEVSLATLPPAKEGFIPFARVIHAKYMVVDGERAWLGTSNWSRDYFHASRNAGLFVEDDAIGQRLKRFFDTGWQSPYAARVDPGARYEPPRIGE